MISFASKLNPRRSRVVIYNGVIYVGGMTADDRTQDIAGQTRDIGEN